MENTGFLLAANVVVWLGVCGYVAFLAVRQKRTEQRLWQLETLRDERRD